MAESKRSPHQFCSSYELDKPRQAYLAGETITGKVNITAFYNDQVLDISLTLQGITKVHWREETYVFPRHSQIMSFKSAQEHILMKKLVKKNIKINKGCYSTKFEFQTPKNMPTSVEEAYGHTRYEITLVVSSPYEFKVYKQAITILKSFDLNLYPEYKRAIDTEVRNMLFWLPLKSSYVIYLKIPQRAYVSGQTLKYILRVDNKFENCIKYVTVFAKKVTFKTKKLNRSYLRNLVIKNVEVFRTAEDNIDFFENFQVPITPPTTNTLNILTVEYFLNVSVTLPTHKEPISISVPVIIGTKPIKKNGSISIKEEQPTIAQAAGMAVQRAGEKETNFKEATDDEVKIYDLEDNDDIPTTSQAARAREKKSKTQEIEKIKLVEQKVKQPEVADDGIDNQPITSQAEEKETELKIIDLEKYSDDEPTTLQAAQRARKQDIEKKEVKKSEVAEHEIDNQPSTSQAASTAAEKPREKGHEKVKEKESDIHYDYYSQEFETSDFPVEPFTDEDYEDIYCITHFKPVYPVYRSPPPSRRSSQD